MTRYVSPRLAGYAALAGLGLVGALALLTAVALVTERDPDLRVALELEDDRAVEGDDVDGTLVVSAEALVPRVEVLLDTPPGLAPLHSPARAVRLGRHGRAELPVRLRCERWGAYVLGDVRLRARGPLAMTAWELRVEQPVPLVVFPSAERLRHLIQPRTTHAFAGAELARAKGDGIEFADLRPFRPGDRRRSINWRASARRRELVVNERRPERSTDVVILLDSFSEARTGVAGTLDLGVRATAALVTHYLDRPCSATAWSTPCSRRGSSSRTRGGASR